MILFRIGNSACISLEIRTFESAIFGYVSVSVYASILLIKLIPSQTTKLSILSKRVVIFDAWFIDIFILLLI